MHTYQIGYFKMKIRFMMIVSLFFLNSCVSKQIVSNTEKVTMSYQEMKSISIGYNKDTKDAYSISKKVRVYIDDRLMLKLKPSELEIIYKNVFTKLSENNLVQSAAYTINKNDNMVYLTLSTDREDPANGIRSKIAVESSLKLKNLMLIGFFKSMKHFN